MTPEQEVDLFEKIGTLTSEIREGRAETKKTLNLITGNGRPEDGLLFRVEDIRKAVASFKDWADKHVCEEHKKVEERLAAVEKQNAEEQAVHAVEKKLIDKAITVLKNPFVATALIGSVAGALGWNKDLIATILKSLIGG